MRRVDASILLVASVYEVNEIVQSHWWVRRQWIDSRLKSVTDSYGQRIDPEIVNRVLERYRPRE